VDAPRDGQDSSKKEILFSNGNRARLVAPPADMPAASVLKALDIEQPEALIIIAGGAAGLGESLKPRLAQLFGQGIAWAAADMHAMIMDGGTQAGVMAIMGQGVADQGRRSVLLGLAPAGKVSYPGQLAEGSTEDRAPLDPNHSHFVLVEGNEWGGETETMYELAEELSREIPVLTVLVNGGQVATHEVLQSVRQGWPIIVVEGTGRLADEIASAVREKTEALGAEVAAIARYDRLVLFDINEGPEVLSKLIHQELFGERRA
jgi:hypothetical protein